MFELTKEEWDFLRCSFCTLNEGRGKHPKYMPYAFTELGVSMLSSILNSELKAYIEEVLSDQNDINEETAMQLELINQSLTELQMKRTREEQPRNPIGFIQSKK